MLLFGVIQRLDGKKAKQQGKHDVLVIRIENGGAVDQIERNLRDQSEDQQPHRVIAEVGCMEEAFRDLKGKDRKRQPAQPGHPLIARYDGRPHMVAEHQRAG